MRFGEADLNIGSYGQECGPVVDKTKEKVHKYMEDSISANTRKIDPRAA